MAEEMKMAKQISVEQVVLKGLFSIGGRFVDGIKEKACRSLVGEDGDTESENRVEIGGFRALIRQVRKEKCRLQ